MAHHRFCEEAEDADLKAGEEREESYIGNIRIIPERIADRNGSDEEKGAARPREELDGVEIGDDADDEAEKIQEIPDAIEAATHRAWTDAPVVIDGEKFHHVVVRESGKGDGDGEREALGIEVHVAFAEFSREDAHTRVEIGNRKTREYSCKEAEDGFCWTAGPGDTHPLFHTRPHNHVGPPQAEFLEELGEFLDGVRTIRINGGDQGAARAANACFHRCPVSPVSGMRDDL